MCSCSLEEEVSPLIGLCRRSEKREHEEGNNGQAHAGYGDASAEDGVAMRTRNPNRGHVVIRDFSKQIFFA